MEEQLIIFKLDEEKWEIFSNTTGKLISPKRFKTKALAIHYINNYLNIKGGQNDLNLAHKQKTS